MKNITYLLKTNQTMYSFQFVYYIFLFSISAHAWRNKIS